MFDLLRTPRWRAFTLAALVAIMAFGALSLWQFQRAEAKRLEFATVSTGLEAVPAAVDARSALLGDWRRVTVSGSFDPTRQFLVRNRPQNGANGFWVVTALRPDRQVSGPAVSADDTVWVVRGWLPWAAVNTDQAAVAAPSGPVRVTGYQRPSDASPARPADDLPVGQVAAVNTRDLSLLANATAPAGSWYLIAASDPVLAPVATPVPTDSRNLSYAGQWLLFATITIGGWWYFLRREAHDVAAFRARDEPESMVVGHGS